MFALIGNWRKNLFLSILMLLFISSFVAQTKQLSAEWWVEQQRLPGTSWQIVKRNVTLPRWYACYHNIIERWQNRLKFGLILYFGYHTLRLSAIIWVWFLKLIIVYMIRKGIEPLPFNLVSFKTIPI